jgi:hypothetical protein
MLADVPQFSASMNPEVLPEATHHAAQHIDEILRLLHGGALGNFEFVREHARRRAEQRFPMDATLHAYRSGHKVIARWLREPPAEAARDATPSDRDIAAIADFALEYTDTISTTFAGTYSAHTQLLATIAGDQRAETLQLLLEGHDEVDLRVSRALREAGFPNRRQVFCVALGRSVDPAQMRNASRARRLADTIDQVIAPLGLARIIDIHANKVTMIFSEVHRQSGWTAPGAALAPRIRDALNQVGNAALIGVSNAVPSTAHIPAAYREAGVALELADVTQRVVQFSELSLQRLTLHFAEEELRRVLPDWTRSLYAADHRASDTLSATLRAYAAADMNVLRTAEDLSIHPNTIYARFQRIADVTGLQPRNFRALTELLIAIECTPPISDEPPGSPASASAFSDTRVRPRKGR